MPRDRRCPVATLCLLVEVSGALLMEQGPIVEIFVSLSGEPMLPIVLLVESSDLTEMSVHPQRLVIQPHQWSRRHTVSLRPIPDMIQDGDQHVRVELSVSDAESEPAFAVASDRQVSLVDQDKLIHRLLMIEESTGISRSNGRCGI